MQYSYEQIEAYLAGEITGAVKDQFEAQIRKDEELAREIALYRDVRQRMAYTFAHREEVDALEANLKLLGKQYIPPKPSPRRLWMQIGAVAAAVALILASGYFIFFNSPVNPKEWYSEKVIHTPLSQATLSAAPRDVSKAQELYNDHKYEFALPELQKLVVQKKDSSDNQTLQIRRSIGICQLELGNYHEALSQFKKLFKDIPPTNNDLREEVEWYIALTYLLQNNHDATILELQKIISQPGRQHMKHEDAEELKELLERLD